MTLEQYRDKQLAALERFLDRELKQLRSKCRRELQCSFDQKAKELRRDIEAMTAQTIADYNARMKRLKIMRRQNFHPKVLDRYEQLLKDGLCSTIELYKAFFGIFAKRYRQDFS